MKSIFLKDQEASRYKIWWEVPPISAGVFLRDPIPRQVLKGEEAVPHVEVRVETQDDVFDLYG